ncbi:UBP-type zinc finger domain-containing protein [Renibacterium salmoninarum]|nr:UBP-type zinc finger domain-containing protein [Renibacterium salmoninarum]
MAQTPGIDETAPPSGTGCAECDHIGCCDTSPEQHASAHVRLTGHAIIRSFEPGENWFYDFTTEGFLRGPVLAGAQSRPAKQPVPGPLGAVPENWRELIHGEPS